MNERVSAPLLMVDNRKGRGEAVMESDGLADTTHWYCRRFPLLAAASYTRWSDGRHHRFIGGL